jgi:hypothetical protein
MDNYIARYENQGMSHEDAVAKALTIVAVPGTSEHQMGLALDIIAEFDSDSSATWTWLKNNSWRYGFILRYPADKEAVTGISFEPWHFRYVGVPTAQEITEKGLCLEEYLELLRLRENAITNPNAATEKPDSTPGQKTTVTPGTKNSNSKQKQKQTQPTDGATKKE